MVCIIYWEGVDAYKFIIEGRLGLSFYKIFNYKRRDQRVLNCLSRDAYTHLSIFFMLKI